MRRKLAGFGLLLCSVLYGQSDAINVTVTKTVDLPPEEVVFNVVLLAEQGTPLDEALDIVKESGIVTNNLTGIGTYQYGPSPNQTRLAYQFALNVPFSKFKDTLDKFAAVRRNVLASGKDLELQTYLSAIAPFEATREQARQQAMPELIADARKKGQFLASTAGVSLGSIVGISDSSQPGSFVGGYVPGPFYGGPAALKTTFVVSVRFGIK